MGRVLDAMAKFPPGNWDLGEFEGIEEWILQLRQLPATSDLKALAQSLFLLGGRIDGLDLVTQAVADEQYWDDDDDGNDDPEEDGKARDRKPTVVIPPRAKRNVGPFRLQDEPGGILNDVAVCFPPSRSYFSLLISSRSAVCVWNIAMTVFVARLIP